MNRELLKQKKNHTLRNLSSSHEQINFFYQITTKMKHTENKNGFLDITIKMLKKKLNAHTNNKEFRSFVQFWFSKMQQNFC